MRPPRRGRCPTEIAEREIGGRLGGRREDAFERFGRGRGNIVGVREVVRALLHLLLGEGAEAEKPMSLRLRLLRPQGVEAHQCAFRSGGSDLRPAFRVIEGRPREVGRGQDEVAARADRGRLQALEGREAGLAIPRRV